MLYDNGPLLALLAQLWQASGDDHFRRAANETADWVLRDMRSPGGGFWSTLDADSEGEEGKFYVWTPAEADELLHAAGIRCLRLRFGLDQAANFEGHWHLQVRDTLDNAQASLQANARPARRACSTARAQNCWRRATPASGPGRDEKILTAWNALMIRGLAMAARALDRDDLARCRGMRWISFASELIVDGQLLACHKDGRARFPAYLDDHAFLLDALLELLQTRWNSAHLQFADRHWPNAC